MTFVKIGNTFVNLARIDTALQLSDGRVLVHFGAETLTVAREHAAAIVAHLESGARSAAQPPAVEEEDPHDAARRLTRAIADHVGWKDIARAAALYLIEAGGKDRLEDYLEEVAGGLLVEVTSDPLDEEDEDPEEGEDPEEA